MKVVVNRRYGGFGLSQEAFARLAELGIPLVDYKEGVTENEGNVVFRGGISFEKPDYLWANWPRREQYRSHPLVVQVVEELKERSFGQHSTLEVVEIPDDVKWEIEEYDGKEWVSEAHRTW